MNPELLALIERIGSTDNALSDEELQSLADMLLEAFDEADSDTAPDLAVMGEIAEATTKVREEQTARATAAAEAQAQAEALRLQMHPVGDGEGEGEGDGEEGAPAAAPAAEGGAPAAAPAPAEAAANAQPPAGGAPATEPVVAGAPPARTPIGALSRRSATPSRQGGPAPLQARAVLRAQRGGAGFATGAEITTLEQLGRIGADALTRSSGDQDIIIASMATSYPKERTLTRDDGDKNSKMMADATSYEAITASGGTCLPVNVDYSLPVLGDTDRPVKAALPTFNADRGGLRFVSQPNFVGGSWASATVLWTEANDISLSSPTTKPILTIACGTETLVYVDAIPTRAKIGNFMARFNPEQVAANLQLIQVAAARFAEINLLNKIHAGSIEVTTAKLLGTVRDLLANLDLLIAAYRQRHRLNDTHSLRAILPSFAKNMMRADLARQLATDLGGGVDALSITDAQINAWFSARSVNVSWTIDPIAAQGSGNVYGLQGFTAAQAPGAITDWPAQVVWWLFTEGDWVFLDGGQLNLGVVRDNTGNNTNDYQMFQETFEGLAFRGVESLHVISTVRPNGASAGTVSTAAY